MRGGTVDGVGTVAEEDNCLLSNVTFWTFQGDGEICLIQGARRERSNIKTL